MTNETQTTHTHTPAPWKVTGDLIDPDADLSVESTEDLLAKVYPPYATQRRGIRNANARLIAAAPDLLAALEALIKDYEEERPQFFDGFLHAQCFNAIAKARGAQ